MNLFKKAVPRSPLLARRVPDLKFDLLARGLDDPRSELHADCVRTVRHN